MIVQHAERGLKVSLCLVLLALLATPLAQGCDQPSSVREATVAEIRSFFAGKGMQVLTFLGYSAAGYEDRVAMLDHANRILEGFEPGATIVNIGATPDGIGAIYEIASQQGFITTGIVSTQARDNDVELSNCVDIVFYVSDATWGGFLAGSEQLSPTSSAMVENSDVMVAIGGGEVARDELIAASRLGKQVRFIPADMNHEIARDKARSKGRPVTTDFGGAVEALF
jgi:hypothetical protein